MRRPREEPLDPNELLNGIAEVVMRIDAKLDRVIALLEDGDGEAEDDS
jgi:hypothetical protein